MDGVQPDALGCRVTTAILLGLLQPPVDNFAAQLDGQARAAINDFLAAAVIGGPETVQRGMATLLQATRADELMLVCDVFDPALRLRSLDIAAAACAALSQTGGQPQGSADQL